MNTVTADYSNSCVHVVCVVFFFKYLLGVTVPWRAARHPPDTEQTSANKNTQHQQHRDFWGPGVLRAESTENEKQANTHLPGWKNRSMLVR